MKGKSIISCCLLSSAVLVAPLFPKFVFADSPNGFTTDNGNEAYEVVNDSLEEFLIKDDNVRASAVIRQSKNNNKSVHIKV